MLIKVIIYALYLILDFIMYFHPITNIFWLDV